MFLHNTPKGKLHISINQDKSNLRTVNAKKTKIRRQLYKITATSSLKATTHSSFQFLVIQAIGTSEMNL